MVRIERNTNGMYLQTAGGEAVSYSTGPVSVFGDDIKAENGTEIERTGATQDKSTPTAKEDVKEEDVKITAGKWWYDGGKKPGDTMVKEYSDGVVTKGRYDEKGKLVDVVRSSPIKSDEKSANPPELICTIGPIAGAGPSSTYLLLHKRLGRTESSKPVQTIEGAEEYRCDDPEFSKILQSGEKAKIMDAYEKILESVSSINGEPSYNGKPLTKIPKPTPEELEQRKRDNEWLEWQREREEAEWERLRGPIDPRY